MVAWGSVYSTTGVDPIQILKSQKLLTKMPGGAVLRNTERWVRPGHFLTRVNSGGAGVAYYYTHTKVSKVLASPAPTTTSFAVGNPHAFVAGDLITVGAQNATVASVDYPQDGTYPQAILGGTGSGVVTLTGAITAPTAGQRVFSQTAANNQVDCMALNEAPYDPTTEKAIEVATSGWFDQIILEGLYHTDDIQALNAAAATGAGMKPFASRQAYRWS